jgi:predicted Fe-Mo cluster-binding NifX family protein
MRIAISVTAPEPGAAFDPRFGRAAAFVIVDSSTGERHAIANPAALLGSGAGIRAAELLVRQGVEAVISGAFGPKACNVLQAAEVRLCHAEAGAVDDLVARMLKGELDPGGMPE